MKSTEGVTDRESNRQTPELKIEKKSEGVTQTKKEGQKKSRDQKTEIQNPE